MPDAPLLARPAETCPTFTAALTAPARETTFPFPELPLPVTPNCLHFSLYFVVDSSFYQSHTTAIMSTFFDTINKSFVDVPVDAAKDNAISTTEFLEAAESLTTLFGEHCGLVGASAVC